MYTFEKNLRKSYNHGKELFNTKLNEKSFTDDDINVMIYVAVKYHFHLVKTLRKEKKISKKTFKKLKREYKEATE